MLRAMAPSPALSVVLPAFNEAATIGTIVRRCRTHTPASTEVIVVDDGSTDATCAEAERAGARVLRLERNGGKGVALRQGFEHARGEAVLMLDADGQDDPAEIPRLLEALVPGVDMVVGSRFLGEFRAGAITPLNYVGNVFLTGAFNVLYGRRFTDTLAGFKIVRAERLRGLRFNASRYDIELELLIALIERGANVVEVPVTRSARVEGRSRLDSFRDGTRVLARIVGMRLHSWRRAPTDER
jgi:glycosyltransferase involved in cell wall biosynthesis